MTDRLDEELSRALARTEAPDGFAERVLARATRERRTAGWMGAVRNWFRVPAAGWAAAAALAVLLAAGTVYHVRRENELRARGEEARAQLMLALRIAGKKLNYAQAKVLEIGKEPRREPRLVKQ